MSSIGKQINRVERLRVIEQRKLDALVGELSRILARLADLESQLRRLRREADAISQNEDWSGSGQQSIGRHMQVMICTEHLEARVTETRAQIQTTQQQRDAAQDEIAAQRAKVRGWETLLERLRAAENVESQRIEARNADDRFLMDRSAE